MSADLFAEFSSTPSSNQQQPKAPAQAPGSGQPASSFSFFDDLNTAPGLVTQSQPQRPLSGFQPGNPGYDRAPLADENDEWGDFEGGSSSVDATPPAKQDSFAFTAPLASQPAQQTWSTTPAKQGQTSFAASSASRSAQQAWSDAPVKQDLVSFVPTTRPSQASWQKAPIVKAKKSTGPSVLFDAEDGSDDEDDFGDFEGPDSTSAPTAQVGSSTGLADLLGDLSVSQAAAPIAHERGFENAGPKAHMVSSAKKDPIGGFGSVTRAKPSIAKPRPSTTKQEDSWDTFEDFEASIPRKKPPKIESKTKETKVKVSSDAANPPAPVLSPTFDDPQPGELPPTNVPPPAVLLSLFLPLFADAQNKLFKPMAAQTLPMRNKLLSEPATIAYLQGYLMLAAVAAHIIAGRKHRWKRDKHLSQGMRIGPASSRATSGMKLSSIDKSEDLKEEREVSDVVRAWKEQIGRLRHVVSAVNQIKAGTLGAVPDLQETMPVKALKQGEGGVPAPQPCMLCGLKRDERVGVVDQGVEDSFGEWWIEQVNMHRGCRNFWTEHRDTLRQR